jgi:hypothetical protein
MGAGESQHIQALPMFVIEAARMPAVTTAKVDLAPAY